MKGNIESVKWKEELQSWHIVTNENYGLHVVGQSSAKRTVGHKRPIIYICVDLTKLLYLMND